MISQEVASRTDHRVALFAFIAAFGMSLGVIVALLAEIQDEFGFSTNSLGLLTGISFVTAFLSYLACAPMADRGAERKLMVGAAVVLIASLVAMAFATELWQWVAARAALGVAQGAIGPAARRMALSWNQESPGKALGDLVSAGALGFVVGPPIGAVLATIDLSIPFLVPAALVLVTIPHLARIEPGPMQQRDGGPGMWRLLKRPRLRVGVTIGVSNDLANGVVGAVYALFMDDLGADLALIGVGFLALVVPIVVFTPYAGRLADRMDPIHIAFAALLIEIPVMVTWGWSGSPAVFLAIGGAHAVIFAFLEAPAQTAVAKASPPDQVAEGQALIEVNGLLLTAIGALLAAPIYNVAGPRWLFASLGMWYAIVGIALVVRRSDWIHPE